MSKTNEEWLAQADSIMPLPQNVIDELEENPLSDGDLIEMLVAQAIQVGVMVRAPGDVIVSGIVESLLQLGFRRERT